MLRELEVRDLGIIDRVRLELPGGFVVLTGETGAGKSLLVQSLQLLAGERADSDQVRGGCDRLVVEGCFVTPTTAEVREALEELGVPTGDEIVVRREVAATGRSRAWLNDVPVTIGALQRLAPCLLSIHGQHESRGLTDPSTHLGLVDEAGALLEERERLAASFAAWLEVREQLDEQRRALASRRDRLDAIAFQIGEIDAARPEEGEEESLREERAMLQHSERIAELVAAATSALGDEGGSVALARAARAVAELNAIGLSLQEVAEELEQARLLAEDAERQLAALTDRVVADPVRLENVETRLVVIERLARKYGGSVAAVLKHRSRLEEERTELEGVEEGIAALEVEETVRAGEYLALADGLSRARRKAAERLIGDVVAVLARLGMPKVALELALAPRSSGVALRAADRDVVVGPDGIDDGELLIAANPGEEVRPMAKIASGGELSRLHLAIRTVLRDRGRGTLSLSLLFDEVDSGIGGHVAEELGELLAALGERDQVLVVTHLPQVAGRAGAHFVVSKLPSDGRTVARVARVEGEQRVEEMVRMLGGGPETPAARQHARELLALP